MWPKMSDCVRLSNVRKSFRNQQVLKGLDLQIPKGSIFGLIGPNGAGKTTTIKILLNMYRVSEGAVEVFGLDLKRHEVEIKKRIGYVSETRALPEYMTVQELLNSLKPMYPVWEQDRVEKYVERFRIGLKRKIGTLSLGERTRVALTAAVAHNPDLLILDEPTNGMDALAREIFFKTISEEYADSDASVLIASNVIPEVERVCDRLAILVDGQVLLEGEVDGLKENIKMVQYQSEQETDWSGHPEILFVERTGEIVTLVSKKPPDGLVQQIQQLQPGFLRVMDMNLTEIFVKVVSRWA